MNKIHQLSPDIIARIAAGEVIERPSYAVKELIENAVDAHATVITIEIEESGLKKIIVADNGEGMSKKDLELCFLPHTTSKLQQDDELIGIRTLGFRGEALSALSSVATLTIMSRTENDIGGTKIILKNNKVDDFSPAAAPFGTSVYVANLFHAVPARKKFLKSAKTEFRHITDIVMNFALSYPTIHFVLIHNKKIILDLSQKEHAQERIQLLLGTSLFDLLVPVKFEDGYIQLKGFIGKPQAASKQNQKQYLFINNRLVTDRIISLAAKEAFGALISASNTPIFVLYLYLPNEAVDVNVHPRKEQVAFIESKNIFDAVKSAITQTLQDNNLTFHMAKFKQDNSSKIGETTSFAGITLKQNTLRSGTQKTGTVRKNSPIIQIDNTYLFIQNENDICIIDQHAAHERILFEQFKTAFNSLKDGQELYTLLKPITLHLSVGEAQIIDEHNPEFEKIGFYFEHFQGTTFRISKVPIVFKGRNIEKIIRDMTEDLSISGTTKSIDLRSERMLAFLSCRAAVKAGDELSQKQMKTIAAGLVDATNNTTCPHGRPTQIGISLDELHRSFKRK